MVMMRSRFLGSVMGMVPTGVLRQKVSVLFLWSQVGWSEGSMLMRARSLPPILWNTQVR